VRVQDLPKKQASIDAGAFAGDGGEIAFPSSSSPATAARAAASQVCERTLDTPLWARAIAISRR
jgi:hypothetical protein